MTFTFMSYDDLMRINRITKYPSIPTYHTLDPKTGGLLEDHIEFYPDEAIIGTEKIDGINARLIIFPDDSYAIGSREELLYVDGDVLYNTSQGIVETLRSRVDIPDSNGQLVVYYLEVYGGNVGKNAKSYTQDPTLFGARMFDTAVFPDYQSLMRMDPMTVAGKRERGEIQAWMNEHSLRYESFKLRVALTPRLFNVTRETIPSETEHMMEFLDDVIGRTESQLDVQPAGPAEGIVIRTLDRNHGNRIAKIRYQNYKRTVQLRTIEKTKRPIITTGKILP